jgi:aryl-alcohol dehydrogenase-like predicted oxidoreductase
MERRKLGSLEVSAFGLGCATMTPFYGEPDPASAIDTIRRARELGIDFLDTSDAYGNGRNEELISRAGRRAPARLHHRQQVRQSAAARRNANRGWPAGIRQDRVRAQPAAAAHRDNRSLLPFTASIR